MSSESDTSASTDDDSSWLIIGAIIGVAVLIYWIGWMMLLTIVLWCVIVVAALAALGFGIVAAGTKGADERLGLWILTVACAAVALIAWWFVPSGLGDSARLQGSWLEVLVSRAKFSGSDREYALYRTYFDQIEPDLLVFKGDVVNVIQDDDIATHTFEVRHLTDADSSQFALDLHENRERKVLAFCRVNDDHLLCDYVTKTQYSYEGDNPVTQFTTVSKEFRRLDE